MEKSMEEKKVSGGDSSPETPFLKKQISYLVEGISGSPLTPEKTYSEANTSDSSELSPFDFLRTDPVFRRLHGCIMQNPEFLNTAVKRMGELDMDVLRYVNENHKDFLEMLFEASDDEKDVEKEENEKNEGKRTRRKE